MITGILLLPASALALSLLLTPLVRKSALHWGLVDLPDGGRKVHRKPIPRIGGIAVFAAYFGSYLAAPALARGHQFADLGSLMRGLSPAALLVFLTGLADDIFGLKPWHKLAAEVIAGLFIVGAGMELLVPGNFPGHSAVAALCTIIWLVQCANAINLIDGLDGLATGMALLATTVIVLAAVFLGSAGVITAAAPLLGALLGFLVFNFNPASIFLGDSGSLLIGFLFGCYGVLWSHHAPTLPAMAIPAIALAIPLTDTSLAIARRFLRTQPIFSADRSHVHHRLMARGFTHRRTVLILYAAAAIAGACSLCLAIAGKRWAPFLLAVLICGLWFGIRKLRYVELETAGQLLSGTAFQHEVTARVALQGFEERLAAAATARDCWVRISEDSREFGFEPMRMQFRGQTFAATTQPPRKFCWTLYLPISEEDWIELAHRPGAGGYASMAIPYIEAIRTRLGSADTEPRPQNSLPVAS